MMRLFGTMQKTEKLMQLSFWEEYLELPEKEPATVEA